MGFGYGLVQGLSQGVIGAQQGKLDRAKAEREAMQEALRQQLMQAQLQNYQATAQEQAAKMADAQRRRQQLETLRNANPSYANLPDDELANVAQANALPQKPGAGRYFSDEHGVVTYSEGGGPAHVVPGARENPQRTVVQEPKLPQQEKASYGALALRADANVRAIESRDPTVASRVAAKVNRARGVVTGLVGRIIGTSPDDAARALEAELEKTLTPEEAAFYQASAQFMGAVLPGTSGKAVTGKEWLMQGPVFFSLGGAQQQAHDQRTKARRERVRGLFRESGEAAQGVLGELEAEGIDLPYYGFGTPKPAAVEAPQGDGGTGGWRHKRPK